MDDFLCLIQFRFLLLISNATVLFSIIQYMLYYIDFIDSNIYVLQSNIIIIIVTLTADGWVITIMKKFSADFTRPLSVLAVPNITNAPSTD